MCDFNCKDCQSFFCSTKPNFKTETTKQIGKEIFVWALKHPAFWCLLEIWRNTHDRNYGDKYISRNFEETRLKLNPMTISTLKKMSHLNFFIFILKKESNWEGEWTLLYVATFLRALKEYSSMTLYLALPHLLKWLKSKKKLSVITIPVWICVMQEQMLWSLTFIFSKAFSRALLFCVSQTKFTRTLGLV